MERKHDSKELEEDMAKAVKMGLEAIRKSIEDDEWDVDVSITVKVELRYGDGSPRFEISMVGT